MKDFFLGFYFIPNFKLISSSYLLYAFNFKIFLGDVGNSAQGMVKVGPPLPTYFPKTQSERIYLNVISF